MLSLLVKLTLVAVLVNGFGLGELHQSRNKRAACGRCCHPVIGNSVFPGSAGAASQNLQFSYIMDAAGCYSLHLKCTGYGAVLLMMDTPSSLNNFLNMNLGAPTALSTIEADIPCTENVWGVAADDGVIGNAFTCQVEAEAPLTGSSQTPPFDYPECYPTTPSTPSTTTPAAPTTTPAPTTVPTPTTAGACTGQWTEWTNLTTCTQDCGMCGTKQMERKCLPAGCTCPGEQLFTKPQICEPGVCFHPKTSCCAGYTKVISNSKFVCEPTPVTTPAPATTKCSGTWGPWVNGTCSDTCGSCGTMTQTRTCSPANCLCSGDATQIIPCNTKVCLNPRTSCCVPYKKTIVSGEFLCLK